MSFESALGGVFRRLRAGERHLVWNAPGLAAPRAFALRSPDFGDGAMMPTRCAAKGIGENTSPALVWSDAPSSADDLALIVQDPDAPLPRPVTHLIAYGVDPTAGRVAEAALEAGRSGAIRLGKGSFGRIGYHGPRPIAGHGPHRYVFQMFALARRLHFDAPPDLAAIVAAMSGAVLARARLTGCYERT